MTTHNKIQNDVPVEQQPRSTQHSSPPTQGQTRGLTDHNEILRWAEERNVRPARAQVPDGEIVLLDLDVPGVELEEALEPISWEEWFQTFEENGLTLLVEDRTSKGARSNFHKLVPRLSEEAMSSQKER